MYSRFVKFLYLRLRKIFNSDGYLTCIPELRDSKQKQGRIDPIACVTAQVSGLVLFLKLSQATGYG